MCSVFFGFKLVIYIYIYIYIFFGLKERRGYCHMKEEALDYTMWRARFRRGFVPAVGQTTK